MKILWLSNCMLSDHDARGSGTWLGAMAKALSHLSDVSLCNITEGKVNIVTRQDCGSVQQWIIPFTHKLKSNGLPSKKIVADIVKIVEGFVPDLVHVWGTENYWGLLTARRVINSIALLETQGLKFKIAKVFHGDLSVREQLACIGLKEALRFSTIYHNRKRFDKWGIFEKEIISQHDYLTVQSLWLDAQVKGINGTSKTYYNDFLLRKPFYTALSWQFSETINLFSIAAYPSSFKGLHVSVRAMGILKKHFPNLKLRIAGACQRTGICRDGYIAWINHELHRLGIKDNVEWLGPLSASQIVAELQNCSAAIFPSFIEGYCLALAEAMMLGVPSVVSYAGGMPCLAKDEESAVFFSPGDYAMCAYQVERLITDKELAMRLSKKSREVAMERNDPQKIVSRQLEIYRQVLSDSEGALL